MARRARPDEEPVEATPVGEPPPAAFFEDDAVAANGPIVLLPGRTEFPETMLSLFPAQAAGIALLGFLVDPVVVEQEEAGDEETHNRSWSYGQWKNYVCSSSRLTARRRNYQC